MGAYQLRVHGRPEPLDLGHKQQAAYHTNLLLKKKNKGGPRPQALIPEKNFLQLDNGPRISYNETTKEEDMNNKTLERIAKALEELIALVKEDLKPRKKK